MDKKHKNIKESLKKPHEFQQDKVKKHRTITGLSPKHQETFTEKKKLLPEKSKVNLLGSPRAITKFIVPL